MGLLEDIMTDHLLEYVKHLCALAQSRLFINQESVSSLLCWMFYDNVCGERTPVTRSALQ